MLLVCLICLLKLVYLSNKHLLNLQLLVVSVGLCLSCGCFDLALLAFGFQLARASCVNRLQCSSEPLFAADAALSGFRNFGRFVSILAVL